MSNFPLYDNLMAEVESSEDLNNKQKDEFMKIIVDIDDNTSELIYALIRVYQLENSENKNTFTLPYDGKFIDKEVKFDLNELPNQLKQILYKFLILYDKNKVK
jgi:hypothetical protein